MTRTTTTAEAGGTTTDAEPELTNAGRPTPGRPAALLAEYFDAHAPLVLGLCRGLLRDAHEAEDAAQQAFLSAYGSLLRGTVPRDPGAWLATIARNECRTRAQRRMREPLPVADTLTPESDPVQRSVRSSEVESLRLALAQLPRQQRKAFLLREFSGLSYGELAVALGVSEPAVESLLFRARRRLRGWLRAAAAASLSVPASTRDYIGQLLAGSDGSSAATVGKLGSFPLAVKLGAFGAGAVIGTAGVVVAGPARHHAASHAASHQRTSVASHQHATVRSHRRATAVPSRSATPHTAPAPARVTALAVARPARARAVDEQRHEAKAAVESDRHDGGEAGNGTRAGEASDVAERRQAPPEVDAHAADASPAATADVEAADAEHQAESPDASARDAHDASVGGGSDGSGDSPDSSQSTDSGD